MINLLPTDQKQANSYGLRNASRIRWVLAFTAGIAGIWAIILFGFFQLNNSIETEQQQVAAAEQRLQDQDIAGVQAKTTDIDSSIKLALQVLEKKVLFSELIQKIGAVIPEGAVLQDIGVQEIEGGINLTALAVDYQSATQVQVNISDPENNVFSQADILNINCIETTEDENPARYPCTVNLRALFGDNNPFLFVNQANNEEINE